MCRYPKHVSILRTPLEQYHDYRISCKSLLSHTRTLKRSPVQDHNQLIRILFQQIKSLLQITPPIFCMLFAYANRNIDCGLCEKGVLGNGFDFLALFPDIFGENTCTQRHAFPSISLPEFLLGQFAPVALNW